jgi:MFS family permease
MSQGESSPEGADAPHGAGSTSDLRALLGLRPFRSLWLAGCLSSFGDWLALLGTTSLAGELAAGSVAQYLAVSGVFILRIAPAVILGPLAGVVADRLDRRRTMISGDLLRFALFATIPIVGTLWWMYLAILLSECVSLFWNPAKDATVPNLVPPKRLELANQLGLIASYGTAPLAALLFSTLSVVSQPVHALVPGLDPAGVYLAIYLNALTFLLSAGILSRLRFPPRANQRSLAAESVVRTIKDGLIFVRERPFVGGLIGGMLGAFAGGGLVIGLAQGYVKDVGAGAPGYGLLFVSVFTGMAAGLVLGPRALSGFSRARLFGAAIAGAGIALLVLGLIPVFVVAMPLAAVLGAFVGIAWVVGYTLLGLEVEDEVRGRTFALVQTFDSVVLVLALAVGPLIAAAIETVLSMPWIVHIGGLQLAYAGATATFLIAGCAMTTTGILAWRRMNDRPGVSLLAEFRAVRQRRRRRRRPPR